MKIAGKSVRATREMWRQRFGPIPEGMVIRHLCDDGRCLNHEHWVLGSQKENVGDMLCRERVWSRLTAETATYAMARLLAGESQVSVAHAFGVSKATICRLWTGKAWSHLFEVK